jgi:hypothetical protein
MFVYLFPFDLQPEERLVILMDPISPEEQLEPAEDPALMSPIIAV